MTLVLMYWKQIILAGILAGVSLLGYQHAYNAGYTKATSKYEKMMKDYSDNLDKRIEGLEVKSTVLIEQTLLGNQSTKLDLDKLQLAIRNKPMYVIDASGKCRLSSDFIDMYNNSVNRVNK